jgi:hypothetical protein
MLRFWWDFQGAGNRYLAGLSKKRRFSIVGGICNEMLRQSTVNGIFRLANGDRWRQSAIDMAGYNGFFSTFDRLIGVIWRSIGVLKPKAAASEKKP